MQAGVREKAKGRMEYKPDLSCGEGQTKDGEKNQMKRGLTNARVFSL